MKGMHEFDKKVERLLNEGKVSYDGAGTKFLWFRVKGDSKDYTLSYDRKRYKWSCTCKGKSSYNIDEDVYCTHMQAADIFRVRRHLR